MIVSIALLAFVGVLLVFVGTAAVAGLSAAPYLPTRWRDVRRALDLAGVRPGEVVLDLGCGDGRFLVEAARRGARAEGYEISLVPFLWSWIRVFLAGSRGLQGSARVHFQNFFRVDLSKADIVVCFLTPPAMQKLSTKVARELHPGARLLSVWFHLPTFTPVANEYLGGRSSRIYLYRKGGG